MAAMGRRRASWHIWLILALIAAMLVTVGGLAVALDLPPGGSFVDDDGNVHEGNIEAIAAEGITKGCNPPVNDRYCPNVGVTRGQMAAFLVRGFGLTDSDPAIDFVDDDTSIFENDIEKLATAGITKGCNPPDNDRYCPDRTVTRGQMAAFLVRALTLVESDPDIDFIDDDGSVFENDIEKLATAGITKGCNPPDNDRFCPDGTVTRDQMASFLARALGLTPITPPPPTSTTTTTTTTLAPGDFTPFELTGSGDDVVSAVVPGDALAVITFTYDGGGNFAIWALDNTFGMIDLLVNEIGAYEGTRPVNRDDFFWDAPIRYLDVTASDSWTAYVAPLSSTRLLSTSVTGSSDDVVRVASGGIADFSYTGSSNFAVWARSDDGSSSDLLVNEIGNYVGTHLIPDWADYLDVVGIGSWTIEYQ